jgi:hypothetical protein
LRELNFVSEKSERLECFQRIQNEDYWNDSSLIEGYKFLEHVAR